MKTTRYLLLLAVILFAFSCTTDSETLAPESQENLTTVLANSETEEAPLFGRGPSQSYDQLENYSQITSFVVAKVIFNHSGAERQQFLNELGSGDTVLVSDLLGSQANGTAFKNRFIDYLEILIDPGLCHSLCCPGGEDDPPFGEDGDHSGGDINVLVSEFIDYVTVDNCIEIFVPNTLNFQGQNVKIASTAHPLTSLPYHTGYERGYDIAPCKVTRAFQINQNYVNNNSNVLVARPYRTPLNMNCAYTEYAGINFNLFLNN